jgi:Kef-type K+ transport system membrane component KefB
MMRRMIFALGMVLSMIDSWLRAEQSGIVITKGLLPAAITPALIAQFSLFVALLLAWVLVCGKMGKIVLHLPTIASQIIAGILLGPSCMNIAAWPFFSETITIADVAHTYLLVSVDLFIVVIMFISASWTVAYLLWIAGHETDVQDMYQIGLIAVLSGIFGALFPIIMTTVGMYVWMPTEWSLLQMVGTGLALAATSVSIPVAMLVANDKMHLKSSKATLGAAIVDDILAVVLLSLYFLAADTGVFGATMLADGAHHGSMILSLVYMVLVFIGIGVFGTWILPVIMQWLDTHHYTHLIAPFAQVVMQLHFACAELVGGIAGITGAYFAGLFHKKTDHAHQAESIFSPYVQAVLLPLFLGSIGLQIDVSSLSKVQWVLVFFLLSIAIIAKLVGCWIAALLTNWYHGPAKSSWTRLETYLFGSAMVARGEVGLVIASLLFSAKIFTQQQYVIGIVVIVLTTIAAPIMLAIGFHFLTLEHTDADEYALNLGLFAVIGTNQMFAIIVGILESIGACKTSTDMSDGRKVITIEGQSVEIMLNPEEGIILKGNRAAIDQIMSRLRHTITQELAPLRVR